MKTGISEIAMVLTALSLCLGLTVAATAHVIRQDSEEVMIKSKAMIIDGSRKMIAADKIMHEAKQMARDGQDPAKAHQMMAKALEMMSAAEKIWEQGHEMADRNKQAKEKMMPIMGHDKNVIHESKIIREGMMIAEAMLAEKPNPLEKRLKMADGSEILKGH